MTQFVPPQFWTRHAVLPGIRAGIPNKNILMFGYQTEDSAKYSAARETHSARSDKEKLPNSLVRSRA